jgi:hypothetical protein
MRSDRGQATVEWIGLVTLVALLLGALLAATGLLTSTLALPGAIMERLVCAVRLTEDCRDQPKLAAAYGDEIAHLIQAHAPALLYEDGMHALPVDYRRCRADGCADGAGEGRVSESEAGEPVVAFTHAIDCRPGGRANGADCSGERRGRIYLSYWFYYPGSATAEGSTPLKPLIRKASAKLGKPTYHPDDWESLQIRIDPDGRVWSRASSHHGYGDGWVEDRGGLHVAGGSHAGRVSSSGLIGRIRRSGVRRTTKDHRIRLVPLKEIAAGDRTSFAVTPPWRKRVFRDPEYAGTD